MIPTDSPQNYGLKFGILILSTVTSVFLIWYTMVRQESVDWISGQVMHQPSTYAISTTEQGMTVVSNVLYNFQIILPVGFKVAESKNPVYYYEANGKTVCQVKNYVLSLNSPVILEKLALEDPALSQTQAGRYEAMEKETDTPAGYVYELAVPLDHNIIRYVLTAGQENKPACLKLMQKIKYSFTEI